MFGRATIRLGIGPHSSLFCFSCFSKSCFWHIMLLTSGQLQHDSHPFCHFEHVGMKMHRDGLVHRWLQKVEHLVDHVTVAHFKANQHCI